MNHKVCAVLVTFNRLEDLKKALTAYTKQTAAPQYLIIVNNASTDGTKAYLDEWETHVKASFQSIVMHTEKNIGGAGGFALGIEKAMEIGCDFVFLADDDAIPYDDMFEKLQNFYKAYSDKNEIAALCTSVIDQYGFSSVQRGRVKKGLVSIKRVPVKETALKKDYFEVDLLTFVGAYIKSETIKKIGLPLKEYFIHEDDAEYSTRIRKQGKILCVSNSKIYHPKGGLNTKNWIEFYTTRNYIDHIRRHFAKRYYYYAIFDRYIKKCSLIAAIMRQRSREFRAMNIIAIREGMKGKLGLHDRYKPGVDVK